MKLPLFGGLVVARRNLGLGKGCANGRVVPDIGALRVKPRETIFFRIVAKLLAVIIRQTGDARVESVMPALQSARRRNSHPLYNCAPFRG